MTRQLGNYFIFPYGELTENQCLFLGYGTHVIKISVCTTREYRDLGDLEEASFTVHHHPGLFQGTECQMSQLAVPRKPCGVSLESSDWELSGRAQRMEVLWPGVGDQGY